jgi:hypothetical protein
MNEQDNYIFQAMNDDKFILWEFKKIRCFYIYIYRYLFVCASLMVVRSIYSSFVNIIFVEVPITRSSVHVYMLSIDRSKDQRLWCDRERHVRIDFDCLDNKSNLN